MSQIILERHHIIIIKFYSSCNSAYPVSFNLKIKRTIPSRQNYITGKNSVEIGFHDF